tara:strand:- start:720 stop:1178 length:459 start_codon:yes stop_codon:yes gene_type:complete
MDPVSAIAVAGSAFSAIKSGFAAGREVESMGKDIMRWMGAIQDIKQGHEKEKKRKSRFATVEEEALESWIIKKKAEEMEDELRQFISLQYGPSAWQQLIKMQADIRKQRQEEEEARQRKIRQNIEYAIAGFLILVTAAIVVSGALLIVEYRS